MPRPPPNLSDSFDFYATKRGSAAKSRDFPVTWPRHGKVVHHFFHCLAAAIPGVAV
jgi:hypothetical protein